MQRRSLLAAVIAAVTFAPGPAARAADKGTAEQAKDLCERAAGYLKQNGPDKAFPAFNDPHGPFVDRDLYVFVRSMDGNTVAHGANVGMIGHTDLNLRDADGKLYNKEMIALAAGTGSGWVDYRWVNPVTKKIEPKSSYVERVGDFVVGVGFYLQQ